MSTQVFMLCLLPIVFINISIWGTIFHNNAPHTRRDICIPLPKPSHIIDPSLVCFLGNNPQFLNQLLQISEYGYELIPVITQFIFTVQYALVSLSKDFLVLELQWLVEFKKFPHLFSKTFRHIYIKKYQRRTETEKTKHGI